MATLHYGNAEFEITDDQANALITTDGGRRLFELGLLTVDLADGDRIHLVTGSGIPLGIELHDYASAPLNVL